MRLTTLININYHCTVNPMNTVFYELCDPTTKATLEKCHNLADAREKQELREREGERPWISIRLKNLLMAQTPSTPHAPSRSKV